MKGTDMKKHAGALALILATMGSANARDMAVTVVDEAGQPVPLVMITGIAAQMSKADGTVAPEETVFTGSDGLAMVPGPDAGKISLRLRKSGFKDGEAEAEGDAVTLTLKAESDAQALAEAIPANAWAAAIDLGDANLKQHFRLQCSFCHQQGTPNTMAERTPEEWEKIIDRMVRYGARLRSSAQKKLPELLTAQHKMIVANPKLVPAVKPWEDHLTKARVTEWALGDSSSQLHDVFVASSGLVYAGDNLQDNLIELDPKTNRSKTHKIPKAPGDKLGGNIGGRLKNYPGVGTYVGLHSLDESPTDGHLFLTGSDSSRLVEFAPETKQFTLYDLPDGFYPHTVRIDQKDRVWFTMAVSNQIAMFDRKSKTFKFYDLPARNIKEKATIFALPVILELANWGVPIHKMPIDAQSGGLPLPYGIEIAPNGHVWFTRLHSDEIGRVNPDTHEVTFFKTPFVSPRRMRADAEGNLWITVFAEGKLAKFDPKTEKFMLFDLPTEPLGSETPYSLNVDRKRGIVWINGTASDSMIRFDIATKDWKIFPLPRRRTFTRDVDIAEDGSIYTSNGSFPAWHIEDGQPTVIRVIPGDK
jgi:virginiamycin B lyase